MKPLCIDLYCGLGGWAEGFLAEGYYVVGFDIERHDYGTGGYPGQLVLQDALTLDGRQFKDATVIVASPPCTEYSYMAMPWSRAKQIAKALEGKGEFPEDYKGSRTVEQLNALFSACFRIQREASQAAGRYIPLIVENVRGAQRWVGRAKANYGSYYLWGDVGMVGRRVVAGTLQYGAGVSPTSRILKPQPYQRRHGTGSWFAIDMNSSRQGVTSPEQIRTEGQKVPGFRFDGSGRSFQSEAVKTVGHVNQRDGHTHTRHLTNQAESDAVLAGVKQGGDWSGANCESSMPRLYGSKSTARKAASAAIAKIPLPLANYIAKAFYPWGGQGREKR